MRGKLIGLVAVLVMVFGLAVPASASAAPDPDPNAVCFMGNPVEGCDTPVLVGNYTTVPTSPPGSSTQQANAEIELGVGALGVGNRQAAQADFMAAATEYGRQLGQPQVGFLDASGHFVSQRDPWRVDVGAHLTNGVNLLRQAQTGPGMAEFDAAYAELAQHL